jgi:putative serine protease PepD
MPGDIDHERRYRRGPAPGRLWSGFELEGGPRPDQPRNPLPPQPELSAPEPEEPRKQKRSGSSTRRATLAGALAGLVVAGGAIGANALFDDDTASTGNGALPPAVAQSAGARASNSAVGRIYAAVSPAVASVQTGSGSGTGFLVDSDGTLVTNAHVVGNSATVTIRFGEDGKPINAKVVGRDEGSDLAVLKADPASVNGINPLAFANSKDVKVGDLAVAIGNPLGLPQTATAGIISGLERQIQAPDGFQIDEVIQTDAPINPGNSGGPLLNQSGEVIGVNSQIATSGAGSGNIGIGFAVPSNTIKDVVPKLRTGQTIERPWLGVSTGPSTSGGAQVGQVVAGSPAERAGLAAGDVITNVDGKSIQEPDDIANAIKDKKPGDSIEVEVRRGTSADPVDVTLGQRPEKATGG